MLRFRKGAGPRNYLARREQQRLFLLVALLGGIVWIAVEARNPYHYQWIWGGGQGSSSTDAQVDTRYTLNSTLAHDTFAFPQPGETLDGSDQSAKGPLTEADRDTIRDDKHFLAAEQGAWFKLLDRLKTTDPATLANQSIGPVTFVQLYRQPSEYRGELITLSGTLRRSEEIAAPRNDLGIDRYFRIWIFPDDSPTNPIVVYTLAVPDGFPAGMTLEEHVGLEGFFFKRWHYAAADTVRLAPVVLARSFRWNRTVPEAASPTMSPTMVMALAAALAAAFVGTIWWRTRPARPDEPNPDVFAGFELHDSPLDPVSHLRLLTDQEARNEP